MNRKNGIEYGENTLFYNMKNKTAQHLIIALFIVPILLFGGAGVKYLLIPYYLYAIFKKDASFLPALVLLGGVSSNPAPVFLALVLFAIINSRSIVNDKSLALPLVLLLLIFPVLTYFVIAKIQTGTLFNHAIGHYSAYLSLFGFFYGIIIAKSCDEDVWKGMVFSLFILSLFSTVGVLTIYARLLFAFASIAICLLIFGNKIAYRLFGALGFLIILSYLDTFTFYLTILAAIACCYLYKRNKEKFLQLFSGPVIWIFTIAFFFFAISHATEYSMSFSTGNALRDRFTMKLVEDRGMLWSSIWIQIVLNNNFLPPVYIDPIVVIHDDHEIEYAMGQIHEHNIYLHCLRNYGYIIGAIMVYFYVYFTIIARKAFKIPKMPILFVVLLSSFVANYVIGGATGNYVTDMSFSLAGMTVLGIAYNKYKEYESSSLVH